MTGNLKKSLLFLALLGVFLIASAPVFAAVEPDTGFGTQVAENKIDVLLGMLAEEGTVPIPENFKGISGMSDFLEQLKAGQGDATLVELIGVTGGLFKEAQTDLESLDQANQALNQSLSLLLNALLENEALDDDSRNVIIAILGLMAQDTPPMTAEGYHAVEGGDDEFALDINRPDDRDRWNGGEGQEGGEGPAGAGPGGTTGPPEEPTCGQDEFERVIGPDEWIGGGDNGYVVEDFVHEFGFFKFYNREYCPVIIGTDGTLSFMEGQIPAGFEGFKNLPTIAPFFADLNPGAGGTVRVKGTSDLFRVSWEKVPFSTEPFDIGNHPASGGWLNLGYTGDATFTTTLYKNNCIVFSYEKIVPAAFAVAIQSQNGGVTGDRGFGGGLPDLPDFDSIIDFSGYVHLYETIVGLSPGNGALGHPGEGAARTNEWFNISMVRDGNYSLGDYARLAEYWPGFHLGWSSLGELNDFMDEFDLEDFIDGLVAGHLPQDEESFPFFFDAWRTFSIYSPSGSLYAVTQGTRDMLADVASLDEVMKGLDAAEVINRRTDPTYTPDVYGQAHGPFFGTGRPPFDGEGQPAYGLQTVGQEDWGYMERGYVRRFTPEEDIAHLNQNGFLAYAVQVEEDRVNRKVLEMHSQAVKRSIRGNIESVLANQDLRVRDDYLTQQADAQGGRVLRDRLGNWVRVQQYILRPDDKTVQLLGVSLRGGNHELSGMSTIDWRTTFTQPLAPDYDLRWLSWGDWLQTREDCGGRWVYNHYYPQCESGAELASMSVKFANPTGESLKETRNFEPFGSGDRNGGDYWRQFIGSEYLNIVSNNIGSGTYTRVSGEPTQTGQYTTISHQYNTEPTLKHLIGVATPPQGFNYVINDGGRGMGWDPGQYTQIPVAFYVLQDIPHEECNLGRFPFSGETNDWFGDVHFDDIWAALGVNTGWCCSDLPNIGQNCLEISIGANKAVFARPIDVVYIPMSRMLWYRGEQMCD